MTQERKGRAGPAGVATTSRSGTSELVIRPYGSSESIPQLTQLLHEAYAHLAVQGLRYLGTHQDDAMTARRLGRGFPLVAYLDGSLVGTATLFPPRVDSPCEWYRNPGVFVFGQFGVLPRFQKQGIGSALLLELQALARARGAKELACDTAEQAEHLRSWYTRLGFRFIDYMQWQITNYRSVVLSKTISL